MKHCSSCEEPGAKSRAALHPITDQWPPRLWLLSDATISSSRGRTVTGGSSMRCLHPNRRLRQKNWAEALGAIDRFADWVAFFRTQLAEAHWQAVFREWIGRLLPATPSAGAHGLIRTAYALRALEDAETPLRVEELGVALAYWAAYYRKLPGTPHLAGALDLGDALGRVPLFLSGQVRPGMPREVYLLVMQTHGEEFSAAVDSAAEPDSVEDALGSLTEAGARLYLANASRQPLVLLHTVTVSAALRLLLPHLPAALHKTALA